ncbi:hypothetical protein [Streptomyces canus]|uniref:hypothetical protein n=1 Tax=Streptomyces canus TaxID=58343 RepID=UPI003255B4C6
MLGISLFVAVVGNPGPAQAVRAFQHIWWAFGVIGLVSGLMVWLPVQTRKGGGSSGNATPAGTAGASAGRSR